MMLKERVLPVVAAIAIAAILLVGLVVIIDSASTTPIRLASAILIGPDVL